MSSARRRRVIAAGAAVAAAAVLGRVVWALGGRVSPPERAAAAMTIVLAVATVLAAAVDLRGSEARARLAAAGTVAGMTWAAAAAAGLAAGGAAGSLGGALVPAAVAVLALGLAGALRALRVEPAFAAFAAAALACVPSALIFVADPWIEGNAGDVAGRPDRAHRVYQSSPLAAMTSSSDGVGVDWQRMAILYDGPAAGVPGLSVVGQYYPSVPPRPVAWGAVVLSLGAALVVASRKTG